MKKIKYLLSIMIIIVVMSTTAYAADETTTSHKDNEMSELDKISFQILEKKQQPLLKKMKTKIRQLFQLITSIFQI